MLSVTLQKQVLTCHLCPSGNFMRRVGKKLVRKRVYREILVSCFPFFWEEFYLDKQCRCFPKERDILCIYYVNSHRFLCYEQQGTLRLTAVVSTHYEKEENRSKAQPCCSWMAIEWREAVALELESRLSRATLLSGRLSWDKLKQPVVSQTETAFSQQWPLPVSYNICSNYGQTEVRPYSLLRR